MIPDEVRMKPILPFKKLFGQFSLTKVKIKNVFESVPFSQLEN